LSVLIQIHCEKGARIDQVKIKKWTIEILEGLEFLHNKKVIHFDIKPANIFLDELHRIKVGDLGIARDIATLTMSFKGTPCYVSPQMITRINLNEKLIFGSYRTKKLLKFNLIGF
jgi:serine/threonine protein kinase